MRHVTTWVVLLGGVVFCAAPLASCATPRVEDAPTDRADDAPSKAARNETGATADPVSTATPEVSAATDREQLLARIEQFNRSIREGDKAGYADVFVDDFVFTWSRNGQIYDRDTILPNVVPTPEYAPLVDEILVRTYGDAAVTNYRVRKNPEDIGVRVTFSYARIDGVWKVIATHSTKIVVAEESDAAGESE